MTTLELSEVTLQVVASPMIIILKALKVSFMLLENIMVQVSLIMIAIHDHHIFIVQATDVSTILGNH